MFAALVEKNEIRAWDWSMREEQILFVSGGGLQENESVYAGNITLIDTQTRES